MPPDKQIPRTGHSPAFTLVELLVVIAVVAVLAALLFPVAKNALASAKSAKCTANLRQIGTAYMAYLKDNNFDPIPENSSSNWTVALVPYLGLKAYEGAAANILPTPPIYRCPAVSTKRADRNFIYFPDYSINLHAAGDGSAWYGTPRPPKYGPSPSLVMLFLDWIPNYRFARAYPTAEITAANGADRERVFRHRDKINAVFADGHVGQLAWPIAGDRAQPPWSTAGG